MQISAELFKKVGTTHLLSRRNRLYLINNDLLDP